MTQCTLSTIHTASGVRHTCSSCLSFLMPVCVCVCMWQDGYILGQLLPLTPPSMKIEIEVFVWWGIPEDSPPPFVLGKVRGLHDLVCLQGWTEAAALWTAPLLLRLPPTLRLYLQKGA